MQRPINKSLQEYARGIAGGLLFSLPLLYTMEVWWAGFTSHPWRLLLYVVGTYILLIGYNYFGGLRHDTGWADVLIDSVEELGLGLLLSAAMLLVLGRVTFDMPASEFIGKIVIEAMTVAIGVSVGTAQLGGGEDGDTGTGGADSTGKTRAGEASQHRIHFMGQVVIALCGAVLFAANVAPTEEVVLIASEISSWNLLGLALISIALGALILFYSDFAGARRFAPTGGASAIIIGTVITYSIALSSSAVILWFFGRFDGMSLIVCLAETVVLGLAATLGASAGRLLLQAK
ncbi:MAG TPA: TIGR02587 family membrane protein [Pyrinomonadaceae bacterium]|jgi:putative integral membrane protein (TIGR02587 family)|nr:TIGR02587 family membrane protein [Pyrinomonadaceae bacterium]